MTTDTSYRVASWRRRLFAGLAVAALLAGQAHADTSYAIDLPAGPLEPALLSLAKQTRQQVFFSKAMVAGRHAPALHGRYTPDQALAALLAATDISASRAGPHLLVLQRTPPAPAPRQPAREADAERPFVTAAQGRVPDEAQAIAPTGPVARPAPATEVEAVEVTGSHIRGAPPASPLLVLSAADLERTGQPTLVDALRTLPENFGGVAGEGNSLTGADQVGRNTTFGSAMNLRGLGNGATLVLINGHRASGSGTFGDFVDISTLPTAAVERVEVLLDGASALYGSDAVAGVVNIVLRHDYDGWRSGMLAGTSTQGGAEVGRFSQLAGRRWRGGGILFSYELQRREPLRDADRAFSRSADLRPFGGTDFRLTNSFPGNILKNDPVTNALVAGFAIPAGQNGVGLKPGDLQSGVVNLHNPRLGEDLLPRQTLNAVYLAADQEVGERLQLTADARYSSRRFKARFPLAATTLTVGRSNPFYVAPAGAATESIAYSFAGDLPNPVSAGTSETLGFTAGGRLKLAGGWRAQANASFAQEIDEFRSSHFSNSLFLNEALGNIPDNPATSYSPARDGYFNPFTGIPGSNSSTVMAFIGRGSQWGRSRNQVASVDLEADGALLQLPGGALKLAVGAQARRETLVRSGMNWLSSLTPVPISFGTDAGRTVTAVFAEARAPLFGPSNARPGLQRLELTLAARVEHYQLVGTTANPMAGLVWAPSSDLEVRGTYSRSFRAPALRELHDPAGLNPVLLSQGAVRVRTLQLTGGNPTLDPETAKSWTGGLDFHPARWPGLTLALTGFDVRFHNRVDRPASVNIANALTDPALSTFVRFISPATNAADLALITAVLQSAPLLNVNTAFLPTEYGAIVDIRYVNTTTLHVRGLDLTGRYAFDVGGDRVALAGNATYLLDYDQQFTPTSAVVKRVNVANFPLRFRARATADWSRGPLTLGGALNYTGAYHDSSGVKIGDNPTIDLQARLAPADSGVMKGLSVVFNVRNVFDRDPPFYNNSQGFAYDPANADPIGRFVSLQLTRAW
jgi:outer membrane receptor protein involved in Fe transport